LDEKQRRSFEAIIASFILTFHHFEEDDYNDPTITGGLRVCARNIRQKVLILIGIPGCDGQLLLLLHGPGGSVKSTVFNLVICYAHEFCDLLGHPFTIQTIVISAMPGIAATLIHGEIHTQC
jgi:hypothetical protein